MAMPALSILPLVDTLPTRIVIPCFEEADRLDTAKFEKHLATHEDVHFVFVDDGSQDRTLDVLEGIQERWPNHVDVIALPQNQGKAEAVRQGVLHALEAGASFVGYWDADLATPLCAIEQARTVMEKDEGIDLVMGARVALLGRSIRRRRSRHYTGRVFATAASLTLGMPVYDTQCGAKLFRVTDNTAELFAQPFISRWIFDVELIARHLQSPGASEATMYEMPLKDWEDVGDSKVKVTDFVRAAGEMARIYRKYPTK